MSAIKPTGTVGSSAIVLGQSGMFQENSGCDSLDLAKFLLGKPYPRAREAALHEIERPLAWLMEGLPVSAEARAMTQEDIKPYRPHPEA